MPFESTVNSENGEIVKLHSLTEALTFLYDDFNTGFFSYEMSLIG